MPPSRAAFLTGRYNHANGITNNSTPFPADAVTHATLLRGAGYKTAYVGKWHMGNQKGPRPGFDYSASFVGQGQYNDCPFEIDGKPTPTKGWVDAVSTDFAIDWIKQNRDKPFSLVVGLKSAHGPRGRNNLPERLRKLYADETTRPTPNCGVPAIFHQKDPKTDKFPLGLADNAVHLDYLRHIAGVDENVGRLLDALDELKLADDTVVVYTSDNGYFLGEHNSGDKRALYDESLRIPFLVRYPRMFGKGKTVDEMVLNVDLAPTLLDLAGVPVPKEMQGASWKELAAGRKPAELARGVLRRVLQGTRQRPHLLRHPHHHPQAGQVPRPPGVDGGVRPDGRPLRDQESRRRCEVDRETGWRVGQARQGRGLHGTEARRPAEKAGRHGPPSRRGHRRAVNRRAAGAVGKTGGANS